MRYFTKDELRSLFVMDDANHRYRAFSECRGLGVFF